MPEQSRQLAAIMFTDIVGYTALMGKDSQKALQLVRISKEIQKPLVEKHNGKWLKEMGDGAMAQFSTALDAVNCSIEIQKTARAELDAKLRIGIHLGDITIENDDVYGDGVNVASRLESIADPGGVYISDNVEKSIRGQTEVQAQYLGELKLKNVEYGVRTYALQGVGLPVPQTTQEQGLSGHFIAELTRRGVLRATLAYLIAGIFLVLLLETSRSWITLPDWSQEAMIIILAIGFPIAMYLAWNFERSPEGFVRTSSKQSWRNPYSASQRKPFTGVVNLAVLGALIVLIYLIPKKTNPNVDGSIEDNSIAIIPWKTIGNDEQGLYFVEGVQEDLRTHLSSTLGLKVKSGRSVERIQSSAVPLSELKVRYLVTGSARKADNRIRINVQLIDAATDDQLWGATYDESYADIFDTQARLAKDIAEALQIRLSPAELEEIQSQPTDNLMAWDYYKRGLFYLRRSSAFSNS